MRKFLILNYFRLSKFMNIKLYPNWNASFKVSYNDLSKDDKKLADLFSEKLKSIDMKNWI